MNLNINSKFLNEAKELESRWKESGLLKGIDSRYLRKTCAVLMESQRFKCEMETEEEYEEYLENFNARQRKALGENGYKNFWLDGK